MEAKFIDWQRQLMVEMERIARNVSCGGAIIDAMIPYKLGWSPKRTARALLQWDARDYERIRALAMGGGEQADEVKHLGGPHLGGA